MQPIALTRMSATYSLRLQTHEQPQASILLAAATHASTRQRLPVRLPCSPGAKCRYSASAPTSCKHHTVETVPQALEAGYRMIDTSGDYHTQRGIGEALRHCDLARGHLRRDQDRGDGRRVRGDARESRRAAARLRGSRAHPPAAGSGRGRSRCGRGCGAPSAKGSREDIGVSNYSIEQIEELVYRTGELPAVNQIEWSPFGHSPRMLDFCHDNHIVIQAWSPLTRAQRLNDDKLSAMAARYGKTPAQLLIRWNLQLGVVPLPKANHAQHQRENLEVFDFEIRQPDMAKLRTLNEHYSALGTLPYV